MTNWLIQAAYIRSKLAKHGGKRDPLVNRMSNLIDEFIRESDDPKLRYSNEMTGMPQLDGEDSDEYTYGVYKQGPDEPTNFEPPSKKKGRQSIMARKSKRIDDDEAEVLVSRVKKDQFALTHGEDIKRNAQQQAMLRETQEKVNCFLKRTDKRLLLLLGRKSLPIERLLEDKAIRETILMIKVPGLPRADSRASRKAKKGRTPKQRRNPLLRTL